MVHTVSPVNPVQLELSGPVKLRSLRLQTSRNILPGLPCDKSRNLRSSRPLLKHLCHLINILVVAGVNTGTLHPSYLSLLSSEATGKSDTCSVVSSDQKEIYYNSYSHQHSLSLRLTMLQRQHFFLKIFSALHDLYCVDVP